MRASKWRRGLIRVVAVCLLAIGGVSTTGAGPASAAPAPIAPLPATGVTADPLPTVQVDGVVWSQVVVGNRVYAGGSFAYARPAGAAPGTALTPRGNLLAYDITTGALVSSFAPTLNAQVLSVTSSPDGRRVYVVGDFTVADGQARTRVAAYDTATGALVASFSPWGPPSQVKAVVATNDTVYVGGAFTSAAGMPRSMLAAYRASDGAVLSWAPAADLAVAALAVTPDGASVFAGGGFRTIDGAAAYGLAKLDATTGALLPWNATNPATGVRNAGEKSGVTSLRVDGGYVYGTTYKYGPGGNLEGVFKAAVGSGDIAWVTACHGDNYSSFVGAGVVYSVGHAHYCGNMGGGFPQYAQWKFQHSQAWLDDSGGEILNDVYNNTNWHGRGLGPSMLAWTPSWGVGSYTGAYQAGWHVTGNADYVVVGGEFPTVNDVPQQGLVRFARRAIAPRKQGPKFLDNTLVPTLVPTGTTSVRVSWLAGYDRDDLTLSYRVYRDWQLKHTTSAASAWWNTPSLGFVDTGLTAGATYSYVIVAVDPDGNTVWGQSTPVTMPTTAPPNIGYADLVRASGARLYWPLNEAGGAPMKRRVTDRAGRMDGLADNGVTFDQPGAIVGGDKAAFLMDNDWSRVFTYGTETAPDTFTVQAWVKTATLKGGRLLGFGDLQFYNSGHRDRMLYLDNTGRAVFGVRAQDNTTRTLATPQPVNDDTWHQLSATMGPAGMALYLDGALVAARADTTAGEPYLGYWRLGGDSLAGWPGAPTSVNLVGTVDEIAVYPSALSASQVSALWQASGRASVPNQPPVAAAGASCTGLSCTFTAAGSVDPDGTITGYAWSFGDATTGTGATTTHGYAAAGTYQGTLTVTDNRGATASAAITVTVTSPPPSTTLAADSFTRTVTGGLGTADVGGAWTAVGSAGDLSVSGGTGRLTLRPGTGPSAWLNGVSGTDVDARIEVAYDKAGSGGGTYTTLAARRVATSDYRLKVRLTATATSLLLVRTVSGVETTLASATLPTAYVAGDTLVLRLQVQGSGSTALRGKAWVSGTPEPTVWQVTATDNTPSLQGPGAVGVVTYLSSSATLGPVTATLDNLAVQTLP